MSQSARTEWGKAEAGVYVCVACRDEHGDACDDYCQIEQVRGASPLWLDGSPPCECCGRKMLLLRALYAAPT